MNLTTSAHRHFPQFRFNNGKKWLYNPVLKKRYANRPEERVRLQFVEYLLSETNFSKNRIGFEAPVKLAEAKNTLRADLVLYNQEMTPFALIECKSDSIRLNEKAAEQIARYNLKVNADFLMITNGKREFWYKPGDPLPELTEAPINPNPHNEQRIPTDTDYWITRGFISPNSTDQTKKLALALLNPFRGKSLPDQIQFFELPSSLSSFELGHYYYINTIKSDQKIAVSILDNGAGNTLLTGILNRKGKNHGILWINLDQLSISSKLFATVISSETKQISISDDLIIQLLSENPPNLKYIGEQLLLFFD